MPVLPQELFDEVLSYLTCTRRGRKTLLSCTLVCRSFLHTARAHLFRRIAIRDDCEIPRCLLYGGQDLMKYVEDLYINGEMSFYNLGLFTNDSDLPMLLESLASYNHLKEIIIDSVSWEDLTPTIQCAFHNILGTESLHRITLDSVEGCPPTLVQRLPPQLKCLTMTNICFPLDPKNYTSSSDRLPKLETLSIALMPSRFKRETVNSFLHSLTQSVVDVAELQTISAFLCEEATWPVYRQIIQRSSHSLKGLYVYSQISDEHFTSVDLSRFPRLENIAICTRQNWGMETMPSFRAAIVWLSQSLKDVLDGNAIHQLTIFVSMNFMDGDEWDPYQFSSAIKEADWERLDTVLSRPELATSKVFRGISFQFGIRGNGAYQDLYSMVNAKLPKTKKLRRLHVKKDRI